MKNPCPKCSRPMVLLLFSSVCDHCDPPKKNSSVSHTPPMGKYTNNPAGEAEKTFVIGITPTAFGSMPAIYFTLDPNPIFLGLRSSNKFMFWYVQADGRVILNQRILSTSSSVRIHDTRTKGWSFSDVGIASERLLETYFTITYDHRADLQNATAALFAREKW